MRTHVSVRPAGPQDEDTLIEFNLRMASETEGRQLDPGILTLGVKEILRDASRGFYLVADVGGEIAGALMITTEWSDWRNAAFWWIQSVYVAPGFRRQGVFRALYEETRERARRADRVCGCRLYVERRNAPAQATYTRLGLTETNYMMFEELLH
jgi:GNAT superfamily N-acetyltransferase